MKEDTSRGEEGTPTLRCTDRWWRGQAVSIFNNIGVPYINITPFNPFTLLNYIYFFYFALTSKEATHRGGGAPFGAAGGGPLRAVTPPATLWCIARKKKKCKAGKQFITVYLRF